jgi:hypothetical protein
MADTAHNASDTLIADLQNPFSDFDRLVTMRYTFPLPAHWF